MKEFVSHYSAALLWEIPHLDVVFGTETADVEITVTEGKRKYVRKGHRVHLCEIGLPKGAVIERGGVWMASPELVFLQLAGRLDVHRLILLGIQMCSHPPGVPSYAVSTKKKLDAFLDKASGHRGWYNAKRAVKYIENGSNSIMESLVFMMLTLPHALGGYGLRGAVFNHEVGYVSKAERRMGLTRGFVDLYYKSEKLAVEYDSMAFHSNPSEQGSDALRSAALERQGIEVVSITTIQAFDPAAFEIVAFNLANRLGKRIQNLSGKFGEMRKSLRALLPKKP